MRSARIPLNASDMHSVNVLHAATREQLQRAMANVPTWQRTALRELARYIEDGANARASDNGATQK